MFNYKFITNDNAPYDNEYDNYYGCDNYEDNDNDNRIRINDDDEYYD